MNATRRFWSALFTTAALLTCAQNARADFDTNLITAGELVVDLRGSDLEGNVPTWMNRDSLGDTMGDFTTLGNGNLNTSAFVSDGTITAPFAVDIAQVGSNALRAANLVPASLQGNSTRSIEAWVFSRSGSANQAIVSWGSGGNNNDSSFNYSNNSGSGMFNGWFNDAPWTNSVVTGSWVHLAYTYDGNLIRGYRNGVLEDTFDANDLTTPESFMTVGSVRGGSGDPFTGLMADVRVHTGVLSTSDILSNYNLGIAPIDGVHGDLDGDLDLDSADLAILRSNLFSAGSSVDGDLNRDGFIDWTDWRMFKDNPARQVGIINPAPLLASTAPEPSSVICLAFAAWSLSGARVRRRNLIA